MNDALADLDARYAPVEAAHRLLQKSYDACNHIWSAHRQCQWCHRMQRDVDAELVASAYLSLLEQVRNKESQ